MTLSDLRGYVPIRSLLKWYFLYTYAVVDQISTNRAPRGSSAIAELFVEINVSGL